MKVLFVCMGNICRSNMAEGLWRRKLAERGLDWECDSAGTIGYHAGEPSDPRTAAVLERVGANFPHVARQVTHADFERFDLLLAMDGNNLRDLRSIAPPNARVERVLAYTSGGDVPDPWFGGPEGFDHVHDLLDTALDTWLARLGA